MSLISTKRCYGLEKKEKISEDVRAKNRQIIMIFKKQNFAPSQNFIQIIFVQLLRRPYKQIFVAVRCPLHICFNVLKI
jgi:hypothetical protein